MRESQVGCILGLIGSALFTTGLALIARKEWKFSQWALLLMVVSGGLMGLGGKIWILWFARTYGRVKVSTWLAFLILFALLGAFLVYAVFQGLSQ
jgi:hypothetical protein